MSARVSVGARNVQYAWQVENLLQWGLGCLSGGSSGISNGEGVSFMFSPFDVFRGIWRDDCLIEVIRLV